ncbi:hypothetical protein HPB49_025097 [Dermacentor silvarum]|uniref:Uncharacterized protein n=1 Tax=Dermacentor silvarum TaxID=543639 RepID=A0ACB8CID9_DERSI|nr:hypothetical protein HPB49_025097 [Dermacentor silvarum]
MDEATSHMDDDTDRIVQATLRQSFAHCTVLTIAHRLETVLDYDNVWTRRAAAPGSWGEGDPAGRDGRGKALRAGEASGDGGVRGARP